MLIGRAAEFAELTAALARASAGHAGAVLVSGDAGVGKTHLVNALVRAARDDGCAVLVGQCAELGESVPYLPLADALWSAANAGSAEADAVRAVLDARPVLGRLLPDGDADPGSAAELGQQQLFGAVLGLLGELGRERPVLLVLEDLHWADRSTRHLLTFLCRVLQRERVCLVGTYRSDDLHRRHPLRPVMAELLRLPNVTGVVVSPFGPGETAAYLAELSHGSAPVTAEAVERVHRRSEGNPFYAAELYSAGLDAPCPDEAADLPAGLADLLLSRMERLSDAGQRVVRVAAVAGRRIDDEPIRRLSGLDEAAAGEALREVVSHQVLVPSATGYTFRHALLREAVYADLLPGERTRLHADYARLLAALPEGTRGAAAELAHHSRAAHDLPVAFAASVRAGREAARLGAPAEAFEHYERALELWDAVPGAEAAAGTDRVRLSLTAAKEAARAGELRRAVHRLRRLVGLADPADLPLGAEIRDHLASYLNDIDEMEESQATAREAVAMLADGPPTVERAGALATYARSLLYRDDDEEMPEFAEKAVAEARAAGATGAEAALLVTLGLYRESREADPRVPELFERAEELADAAGDHTQAVRVRFHHARAKFDRGDLAGAARAADEGVRFVLDNGLRWHTYGIILRSLQYLVHYTVGDWAEANRLAEEFPVRVVRTAEAQISAYALFVDVAQGSPSAGERLRWIEPLWAQHLYLNYLARGLAAERALWRDDPRGAVAHVENVLATPYGEAEGALRLSATGLWAHAELAARARATGDQAAVRAAGDAADGLLRLARTVAAVHTDGRPRAWLGLEGHAWLARAEAERRRVDGVHDVDLWRKATDLFTYGDADGGFVYEVARSRWRLAEALAENGDRDAAAAEWRAAVERATALGAEPLLAALRDLGARARLGGGSGAGARQSGPSGALGSLTVREREVLKLVADGLGNREIASRLFISPKTASVHVSNILAKLNVASRTQAAAVAHREGLE
ncbi:helix-turn-helix transcriptional regulator [Actinomadura spongiicola]|uniref:helix-turn-helix transcriptional regulator n=1 Tax=Actinomadura spongiicola TaxID=2303421 RepID=UPI0026D39F95|nr:AAA family ATPase [Actinomadura spongiicola]